MKLRWSHAVLRVSDMQTMIDFYTRVMGFEVTDRGLLGPEGAPEIVFMSQVETDHHQLALVGDRGDESSSNNVNHFAFRVESLDDVKQMNSLLDSDARVTNLMRITHGNAWSVYFSDPEGNGIEIFCDSPFHVSQPKLQGWNIDQSNEEILEETRKAFENDPEFGPIDEFYAARARQLKLKES